MSTGQPAEPIAPTRLARGVASANVVLFALMRFAQWMGWGGIEQLVTAGLTRTEVVVGSLVVLLVNVVFGLVLVAVVLALHPERHSWPVRVAQALVAGAVVGALRLLAMSWVPAPSGVLDDLVDWLASITAYTVAVVSALVVGDLVARYRLEERLRAERELATARTIARLEAEEAVRRRIIADQLHGTVQNRLVVATAGLDRAGEQLSAERHPLAPVLHELSEDLEQIREHDVRSLSQELFPTAADVSTTRAVAVLLDRLPPSITGTLELTDAYRTELRRDGDPLPLADRLVVIDTIEEGLTNALKHGHADRVTITLDLRPATLPSGSAVLGTVDSNGGSPPADLVLHGLDRHRARLEARGGHLALGAGADGTGARLAFDTPVPPRAPGYEPPHE
ncbi:MAG TPA: hypothetical protein VGC67_03070 [Cellulomonas sp.]